MHAREHGPGARPAPLRTATGSRSGLPRPLGSRAPERDEASPAAGSQLAIEILSHELRSPITTIHLGTKVLRQTEHRIPEPVRLQVIEAVDEEAERLFRLVEDLLAVARYDGGAAPIPGGPLLLQRWLPEIVSAEVATTRRLRVRAMVPRDVPPVIADDGALAQVIRNVLANAARYASDGMPVEIVAHEQPGGIVELDVCDRGPGIDPDDLESLFEPFFRSARARAAGSAAGLGLAAAQRLLVAMGGAIEARPRQGGGACFVVTLPAALDDAEADA